MTKEEIAKTHVSCRCDEIYTSRGLTAPDCPYHSTDAESAMDEWAKHFGQWLTENTTTITDYPNIILYRFEDKNDGWGNYTLDDIYEVFSEQQNK